MRDPGEGVSATGVITTGAARERVPLAFEPVVTAAIGAMSGLGGGCSLYVYGSVATGTAVPPSSDVDLLTIGLPTSDAAALGHELSARFASQCRAVEIAAEQPADLVGEHDEAYGNRAFLHHYCVHLTGPRHHHGLAACAADARAARAFNGDIVQHARRWRSAVPEEDPATLGRRLARKTLFAVAGLVSMHDATWTTDRAMAAARWAELEPAVADDLARLLRWSDGIEAASSRSVSETLDGIVARITDAFAQSIGLWDD